MANHKSALKRFRQSEKRRVHNRIYRNRVRTLVKKARTEISAGSDLDAQEVWEWGYLERVSTGLYVLAFGALELAQPFFRTAELLMDA